jgi:hypothetical protein
MRKEHDPWTWKDWVGMIGAVILFWVPIITIMAWKY